MPTGQHGKTGQRHAALRTQFRLAGQAEVPEAFRGKHNAGYAVIRRKDVRSAAKDHRADLPLTAQAQDPGKLRLRFRAEQQLRRPADAERGMPAERFVLPDLQTGHCPGKQFIQVSFHGSISVVSEIRGNPRPRVYRNLIIA